MFREQKPFVNIWELAIKKMEEKENQVKEGLLG